MTGKPLLVTFLVATLAGCGLLRYDGEPSPERRMELGLAALADRDLSGAQAHFGDLYTHHWRRPIGRQALMVLVAAELDPRNPGRRLWAAADMTATLLNAEDNAPWLERVAETLYLLALELGANEERIARAEARLDSVQALPTLPGPSFVQQLQDAKTERDSLRRRILNLEQSVAAKEKEIQEKDQELERIRRTLRG